MNPRLRSEEWVVLDVPDHAEAVAFIVKEHYAGGDANTSTYRHGLYRRDEMASGILRGPLRGVAMWQPPTKGAALTVSPCWQRVLSLSRVACDPGVPSNGASFLLGAAMRMVDRWRWPWLLTYADRALGHDGTIYRATNWECWGEVAAGDTWTDGDGVQRGRKRGGRTLTAAEMESLGFARRPTAKKVKFVHVDRRRASRCLREAARTPSKVG